MEGDGINPNAFYPSLQSTNLDISRLVVVDKSTLVLGCCGGGEHVSELNGLHSQ